ncbi:MAG: hypothetical protein PHS92_04120 [Candidatus Gracilibacteria bacterium]|nr:hypothetical protein [Candidatus Gracilibacteria bacterium]
MAINKGYSKIQRYLSYFLIFSLLFSNTIHFSFFDSTKAEAISNTNIVSIIVDEQSYNELGLFSNKLKRYAEDIQGKLDNTKVIIYKVPSDINPIKIAQLNERLFYEGTGDKFSRLIGTILVGNIPLPVIHNNGKTFLSIYPYIDFNEKNFIYNTQKGFYESISKNITDPNPEIWHSVISPNTGIASDNSKKLNDFFDKSHDYYLKQGVFSKTLQDPYIFYFDGFRDEQSVQTSLWKAYVLYLQNIEDITYERINKYLAKDIYDKFNSFGNDEISKVANEGGNINPGVKAILDDSKNGGGMDFSSIPDMQAKSIIAKATKRFVEIFNGKHISDMLNFAYNTGRYGDSKNARIDSPSAIITKRDQISQQALKDLNTTLEDNIDKLVSKDGLSRKIALPVRVEEVKHYGDNGAENCNEITDSRITTNFYFGKNGGNINEAKECSIYRGTKRTDSNKGVMVEQNRSYNIDTIQKDIDNLSVSPNSMSKCYNNTSKTLSLQQWGSNSPLNLDLSSGSKFTLKTNDYRKAISPLFEVAGGKQIGYNETTDKQDDVKDISGKVISTYSPNDCSNYNFIQTSNNNGTIDYSCIDDKAFYNFGRSYDEIFAQPSNVSLYHFNNITLSENKVYLDDVEKNRYSKKCSVTDSETGVTTEVDCNGCSQVFVNSKYYFKSIPSIVTHKSPTLEELGGAYKNIPMQSLASDRDRYVDFISAKGNYKKIIYPNFFRIKIEKSEELTYPRVKMKLKEYLDKKSDEINTIISSENPSALSSTNKDIYDSLKISSTYPSNVDLFSVISNKQEVMDLLIDSIIWSNISSATAKYKYVLENYLDTDQNSTKFQAGHKNDYELAYIGGRGDSKNMYVKLEATGKSGMEIDSIKSIKTNSSTLRGLIDGSKVSSSQNKDDGFKCGPPEGVPIFQWLPQVFCWLKSIVPPISLSSGSCSPSGGQLISGSSLASSVSGDEYGLDGNGNGIPDGAELIQDGKIELKTDKKIYLYDSSISVEAKLISSKILGEKLIQVDNLSQVKFDLVKVDAYSGKAIPKNLSTIYDKESSNQSLSNISNINSFVNLTPQKIRVQNGIAKFAFGSKQKDIDIYIRASIETLNKDNEVEIYNESNIYLIKIRGDKLNVSAKKGEEIISNVTAGENIIFELKKQDRFNADLPMPSSINLKVYDSISNVQILEKKNINFTNSNGTAKYVFDDKSILEKSSVLKFEFNDGNGTYGYKEITILPSLLKTVKVTPSSNIIVKGGNVSVFIELLDEFGNYTKGSLYNLDGVITSSQGIFADSNSKNQKKAILEGFTYLTAKASEVGDINMKFIVKNDTSNIEYNLPQPIKVIDYAKISLDIENKDNIVAGKEKHKINVIVKDRDGKKIDGFNSVLYFDFPKTSGSIEPNYVQIKDGKNEGEVNFVPNFVAGKDLKINLNLPGVNEFEGNVIEVLPDIPVKIEESISKDKIEAKKGEKAILTAKMYDRYGNVAYNAKNYKISFSIPDEYKTFAEFEGSSFSKEENVEQGIASTTLYVTDIPGSAYIVANSNPGLESNTVVVNDSAGKSLTINGYSKDAILLDTYYFFNKEKLENIKYNSLYTVLLGADYGNITSEGYLGGEIIFNKDSRSLAVTSLLNNTNSRQTAFSFTPGGKYSENNRSDELDFNLEKEIGSDKDGTYISFYDSVYKDLISKVRVHLGDNTGLYSCSGTGSDISNCSIGDNSSIILKGFDEAKSIKKGDELNLMYNGVELVKIGKNLKINKDPSVDFELDGDSKGNILGIKILSNDVFVGYIGIKIATETIKIYNGTFTDDGLYIESASPKYSFDYNYLGISSNGDKGISFFKNDFGADSNPDNDLIGPKKGIEDYENTNGIGWQEDNKMLLEFAAGSNVGDSTKFYQTYSTINLGDPVVKITPNKTSGQDFDKSIGKRIFESNGEPIESYKKIDFNGDGQEDIVIFSESGKIKLLSNYAGQFKDMGYLAYVSDAGKLRKGVGDFSGDTYFDIAMVDNKGALLILDNTNGKFIRKKPKIYDVNGAETSINGAITQLEIFDMDKDSKDDIVTVDDSGEINILYGTLKNGETVFTKKFVDNNLGVKINSDPINGGGAVYFDGLPQIKPKDQTDQFKESQDLLKSSGTSAGSDLPPEILANQLDKLVYYQYKYSSGKKQYSETDKLNVINSAVGTDENGNPNADMASEIMNLTSQLKNASGKDKTNVDNMRYENAEAEKTFVRSQFAEGRGVKIEKIYIDENGGNLKSGDKIKVNLRLTNNTNSSLNNLIYLDSNNNGLIDSDNLNYIYKTSSNEIIKPLNKLDVDEFNYLFDDINILPNQSIEISYELIAPSFSFGDIKVGMLEKTDIYGGISLNPTKKCNSEEIQWKSVQLRIYNRTTKKFTDNSELPESFKENEAKLANVDKIKSVVQNLPDSAAMKNMTNTQLDAMMATIKPATDQSASDLAKYNKDSNGNGIPDREEKPGSSLISYDQDSGGMDIGGLSSLNVDQIDSQIDGIIQGLGCGFGGGACISSPLNYAPLAPGSSPTIFGMPVSKKLMNPGVGLPVFAFPTFGPIKIFGVPVPPMWPINFEGAGGFFDGFNGSIEGEGKSMFRLFITPTITGAVGIAMCVGPNNMFNSTKGTSPLVPGGNCIVAATPMAGCGGGGSDGDASSISSNVFYNSGNSFINANSCIPQKNQTEKIPEETRENIISYVGGNKGLAQSILSDTSVQHGGLNMNIGPLLSIGGGTGEGGDLDISIDGAALMNLDMANVMKVNFKRVASFPDFIMDWVTRQIEEIVTKLTTLPTLFIILPDFSSLSSKSMSFASKINQIFNNFNSKNSEVNKEAQKTNPGMKDFVKSMNKKASAMVSSKNIGGLQFAYKFLSSIPLVDVQTQVLELNIPWISPEDLDKWVFDANNKLKSYKKEYNDKAEQWERFVKLQDASADLNIKVMVDAKGLIDTLEKNINVLEEYKNFPDKLVKLLKIKEKYTEQIICNIGIIQNVMGGYIEKNGKRFMSWVKLIILIKAILKSWQLLIDLFYDYKASCESCKNERFDIMYFIIKLISALIPSIPVIQFPKWPDIILDMHNIRAGITIMMPDFKITPKPIILPQLPDLTLPSPPKIKIALNLLPNFTIPSIPTLPSLPELPDLPDIPSLPEVKLPDLPPPPTIPNLLGSISGVLSILKLLSKLYCVYQNFGKFFTPEWKAGDSIAYITERNGTLPIDFLFIDMPQFSYSFVDAIKVTSQVNFEFEVDFILQLAKTVTDDFNRYSSSISDLAKMAPLPNLNLDLEIQDINVDINANGAVLKGPQSYNGEKERLRNLVYATVGGFFKLVQYIDDNKNDLVSIESFESTLKESIKDLASSENPKERKIYTTINSSLNYSFEKENKIIKELKGMNDDKFNTVKDYLNVEKNNNSRLISELESIIRNNRTIYDFSPLQKFKSSSLKVSYKYESDTSYYKEKFEKINNGIVEYLKNDKPTVDDSKMVSDGQKFVGGIKDSSEKFKKDMAENETLHKDIYDKIDKKLYAFEPSAENTSSNPSSSDSQDSKSIYSYNYEGLYIVNSSGVQSSLFNYSSEISGSDKIIELDYDKDGDNDILYKMSDGLYIKDNLKKDRTAKNLGSVEVVDNIDSYLSIQDGRNIFAPNHFIPSFNSQDSIEFSFSPGDQENNSRFRLEFYDYINRFDNTNNDNSKNEPIFPYSRLYYIDMIADPKYDDSYVYETGSLYKSRYSPVFIQDSNGEGSVLMKDFKILKKDESIIIQKGNTVYSDLGGATIKYKKQDGENYEILQVKANSNVEFNDNVQIVIISGNILLPYENTINKVVDLATMKGFPVLPGTKIDLTNKNSEVLFGYSDGNSLKINNGYSYLYNNLGEKSENYNVSLNNDNGFYFGKLYSESRGGRSNITDVSLFAPQLQSDNESPLINVDSKIKLPVYKKLTLDLKKYVDDVSGISEIYVDGNIKVDSDGDKDPQNDKDSLNPDNPYGVKKGSNMYILDIGSFDMLGTKKFRLYVKDNNSNLTYKDLNIEIYAPIPQIKTNSGSDLNGMIGEQIKGEPIDFYRFRDGIIDRIKTSTGTFTSDNGAFSYKSKEESGLVIKNGSGIVIAEINEKTGKVNLKDAGYLIDVSGSDQSKPVSINIRDKSDNKDIFTETLNLITNKVLERTTDFNSLKNSGIYVKLDDNYDFAKNSNATPNLKNGGYVTDESKNPIIGISLDGNIYLMNRGYDLKYSKFGDYIVIDIIDGNDVIGEVLYKIESEFVLK